MFFKKCNWTSVFLWGLAVASLMIACSVPELYFNNFNDTITFYALALLLLFWGTITGLSHKEDSQYCIIKKAFLIFFISMTLLIAVFSVWIFLTDPIEIGNYFEKTFRTIAFAIVGIAPLMSAFFIAGYIIAFIVKLFGRLYKN